MKNKELNEIKKIKNEIIEGLKNEIKVIEDISSFINNLIDTYYFEKNLNNYNYEIIENLKNIRKIKLTNENIKNFNF